MESVLPLPLGHLQVQIKEANKQMGLTQGEHSIDGVVTATAQGTRQTLSGTRALSLYRWLCQSCHGCESKQDSLKPRKRPWKCFEIQSCFYLKQKLKHSPGSLKSQVQKTKPSKAEGREYRLLSGSEVAG